MVQRQVRLTSYGTPDGERWILGTWLSVRQPHTGAVGSNTWSRVPDTYVRPVPPAFLPHDLPPHPQIDKPEIRLRRTITAKKDDYTLDKKHIKWDSRGPGEGRKARTGKHLIGQQGMGETKY